MSRQEEQMISCAPRLLYGNVRWHDDLISLEELISTSDFHRDEFDVVGELFHGASIIRRLPNYIDGSSTKDVDTVIKHFSEVNDGYRYSSPVYCVRIRRAVVWHNMIFIVLGDDVVPLYENFKSLDRKEKGSDIALRLKKMDRILVAPEKSCNHFFFGSSGSFNYGHWLIDDFPRYKALSMPEMQNRDSICFLSQLNSAIDAVRIEALKFVDSTSSISSRLIDPAIPHEFENLIYVTPCSEHPFTKNQNAVERVRQNVSNHVDRSQSGRRIFVNRSTNWPRHVSNIDEVLSLLRRYDFEETVLDNCTFHQQAEMFTSANLVVGIMGAGMANTMFCKKGTRILYLAPSKWQEPFFWDLATTCQHEYNVLFGDHADVEGRPLHQKSFKVNLVKMAQALSRITSN